MLHIHAIWFNDRLHLWGLGHWGPQFSVAPHAELRMVAGDLWDSLLISAGQADRVTLTLPRIPPGHIPSGQTEPKEAIDTQAVEVPTLAFYPAEAMDLLSSLPSGAQHGVILGASLLFWGKAARWVLDLLARQRFVPDLERMPSFAPSDAGAQPSAAPALFRGRWRPLPETDDLDEMRRLTGLMPRVCLSALLSKDPSSQLLFERFLAAHLDALVRRTLVADELSHGLLGDTRAHMPLQTRWLRSLVDSNPVLSGTQEELLEAYRKVREWVARLEPSHTRRTCRLYLTLNPPKDISLPSDSPAWTLGIHAQAIEDPGLIVRASELPCDEPPSRLIRSPFWNAREQLRADLLMAAKIFAPLAELLRNEDFPDLPLTTQGAYSFLRDAAPLLEAEGICIAPPPWWTRDHARLKMRLDLRPLTSQAPLCTMRVDALVSYDWKIALGDDDLTADEIAALAAAKEPLVRLRGRWTEVQTAEVQAALRFRAQNPSGSVKLFEALRRCYMVDDTETGLPVSGVSGVGWVEQFLNSRQWHDGTQEVAPPAGFHGTLRPYQIRGLQWLHFMNRLGLGACLADDMGLGKTIQLIALLLHERETSTVTGPTLLIVPMSLVGNWRRELERFAPGLKVLVHHGLDRHAGAAFLEQAARHDVVISTYALAHRDFEFLSAMEWHRITLDEAQNIKNPAAKQSGAVRALRALHRVALTGTPVENRLSELWSILHFLAPGYLGPAAEFRRRFAVPIERQHDGDRAARLRDLVRPFVLRRLKSDPAVQVDLPPKMEMKVYCNLTREQAALYEAVVQQVLSLVDCADGIQRRGLILAALTKLKQICNHPVHFLRDGSELSHRSGKCERLMEMLDEILAENERALVFTQYRAMGSLLEALIKTVLNRSALFLHGGTPRGQRDALIERFQNLDSDASVFILSLKAGGFGLNLTAAHHVFHFDRWWNPAVEDQATDRAHRIGQESTVQVHKFICIGTLEERIDAMLMQKRSLADSIIGTGEQWITELSTAALRELFTLSREDAIGDE